MYLAWYVWVKEMEGMTSIHNELDWTSAGGGRGRGAQGIMGNGHMGLKTLPSCNPAMKLWEATNVFMGCVPVCSRLGVPMRALPIMHWTSLYRPLSQTWNQGTPKAPPPPLVTSCGHHWIPVQTWSLDLIVEPPLVTFGNHWIMVSAN